MVFAGWPGGPGRLHTDPTRHNMSRRPGINYTGPECREQVYTPIQLGTMCLDIQKLIVPFKNIQIRFVH